MKSIFVQVLSYLFYPFTYLYRLLFYIDSRLTTSEKLSNSIVISIGNLSVGGTGKTPFTIFLSKLIQSQFSSSITILSRGYRGKLSKVGMKVELDSSPLDSGDEPFLIKQHVQGANVIIGADRVGAFQKYRLDNDKKSIVILDDGLQHHRIYKDYNFVLIDAINGLGNGMVIPSGTLRMDIRALRTVDSVVFTKVTQNNLDKVERLKQECIAQNPKLHFYYFSFVAKSLRNRDGQSFDLEVLRGKNVFLFSGIGNPEYFFQMIQSYQVAKIKSKKYQDHSDYTVKEIQSILDQSNEYDWIICTEKDYVKIQKFHLNMDKIYYLEIDYEFKNREELIEELNQLLKGV